MKNVILISILLVIIRLGYISQFPSQENKLDAGMVADYYLLKGDIKTTNEVVGSNDVGHVVFIAAEMTEVTRVMDIEITSVEGDKDNFVGGQTRIFTVYIKNNGNDEGNVQLWVESGKFYGTADGRVEGNGRTLIRLPVIAKAINDDFDDFEIQIVAFSARKIQDKYPVIVSGRATREIPPPKGICGPTAIVLVSMFPILFLRMRLCT